VNADVEKRQDFKGSSKDIQSIDEGMLLESKIIGGTMKLHEKKARKLDKK
jgi:hypothetical protein